MILFPAIDLKDGACVRLSQGEMDSAEQVADSALQAARSFSRDGARWVHMVDLNGACEGERVNSKTVLEVAANTPLQVEVGGGIRTPEDIAFYLERGVSRVILGSAALNDPCLVENAVLAYGDRIVVGIDARNGMVAAQGWLQTSQISYLDLARQMDAVGVRTLIFTDIARDGMLSGPNLEQLTRLNDAVSCQIVASGGIRDLDDIRALRGAGLYGAICGRSLYKGTLSLREAVKACEAV